MKIDVSGTPDPDIFRDRPKYIFWFSLSLTCVAVAVGIGLFAIFGDAGDSRRLGDWALGILVASALVITWFGNKLQKYKKLFPPQVEKLQKLRSMHPNIEKYCSEVESSGRRLIRAEYEACVEYSENHSEVPFV